MGSAECCGKCLLIFFNIMWGIVGLIILALGVALQFLKDLYDSFLASMINSLMTGGNTGSSTASNEFFSYLAKLSIPLICVGAVLFILSFIGCCGACCKSRNALLIYGIVMGVIVLAEIVTVIVVVTMRDTIKEKIKAEWQLYINSHYDTLATDMGSILLNVGMFQGKCCGINGYNDFDSATKWNRQYEYNGRTINAVAPLSCCKFTAGATLSNADKNSVINIDCLDIPDPTISNYQTGCWSKIEEQLDMYKPHIIAVLVVLLVLELILVAFAFIVASRLKKSSIDPSYDRDSPSPPRHRGRNNYGRDGLQF